LQHAAQQDPHRQRIDTQTLVQQQRGHDDAQVVDGRGKGGEGEALEREQRARHHAGDSQEPDSRRHDAQQAGRDGQQLRGQAAGDQMGQRLGQQHDQHHDAGHHQADHR
jgi:hypothetical protein